MARKIRLGIASTEGARMFSNTVTCVPARGKRNPDASDMPLKALSGT